MLGNPRYFPRRNEFLQPNLLSAIGKLQWISAINNLVFILLALIFFYFLATKKATPMPPYWLLVLPFAILSYLIIGYTVPFSGAIVRYKVIAESCFILFFLERILAFFKFSNQTIKSSR